MFLFGTCLASLEVQKRCRRGAGSPQHFLTALVIRSPHGLTGGFKDMHIRGDGRFFDRCPSPSGLGEFISLWRTERTAQLLRETCFSFTKSPDREREKKAGQGICNYLCVALGTLYPQNHLIVTPQSTQRSIDLTMRAIHPTQVLSSSFFDFSTVPGFCPSAVFAL